MTALKTTITGIVANAGSCIHCGAPMNIADDPKFQRIATDEGPVKIDGKAVQTIAYVCPRCAKK